MRATHRTDQTLLVSQLTQRGRPLARLVTLDAPGETYRRIFRDALLLGRLQRNESEPETLAIARLLDEAEGLLLLLPANLQDDLVYSNFLQALSHALHPRAMKVLSQEGLRVRSEEGAFARLRARNMARQRCEAFLERLAENASQVPAELILSVRKLSDQMRQVSPDRHRDLRQAAQAQRDPKRVLVELLRSVARQCLSQAKLLDALLTAKKVEPPSDEELVEAILIERGAAGIPWELNLEATPRHFTKLRQLHFVITKSDMFSLPVEDGGFAQQRLPRCMQELDKVRGYLRLLGGAVRFHRASAAGYSLIRGARAYPGVQALTPINIVEPVLAALNLPGAEDDL